MQKWHPINPVSPIHPQYWISSKVSTLAFLSTEVMNIARTVQYRRGLMNVTEMIELEHNLYFGVKK
jgi:hypothetical protein